MSQRIYALLARLFVCVHAGIVVVVLTPALSLLVGVRPPQWIVISSAIAILITVVSFFLRGECLLNILERSMRKKAGQADIYQGSCVEHYTRRCGITVTKNIMIPIVVVSLFATIYYLIR